MTVRNLAIAAVAVLAAVAMIVAQLAGWSGWARVLILIVLGLSATAVWLVLPGELRPEPMVVERVQQAPEYQQTVTGQITLPSALTGFHFQFSAAVWWRPIGAARGDWAKLAEAEIVNRANALAAGQRPVLHTLLARQLEAALAIPLPDRSGRLEAMAGEVVLTVPEGDRDRLAALTALDQEAQVAELQRRQEKSRREYLGGDVFKTPGRAVVWWLAQQGPAEGDLRSAENLLSTLALLSAAANEDEQLFDRLHSNGHAAPPARLTPGGHLREVMAGLGLEPQSEAGQQFLDRVAKALAAAGLGAEAGLLLREFGIEPMGEPGEEPA